MNNLSRKQQGLITGLLCCVIPIMYHLLVYGVVGLNVPGVLASPFDWKDLGSILTLHVPLGQLTIIGGLIFGNNMELAEQVLGRFGGMFALLFLFAYGFVWGIVVRSVRWRLIVIYLTLYPLAFAALFITALMYIE